MECTFLVQIVLVHHFVSWQLGLINSYSGLPLCHWGLVVAEGMLFATGLGGLVTLTQPPPICPSAYSNVLINIMNLMHINSKHSVL